MSKVDFPDVGYTPNNLRALLRAAGITQKDCARTLDVTLRTVQNWCAPIEAAGHTDMPTQKWELLKKYLIDT